MLRPYNVVVKARAESGGELGKDKRIVRATAGDDELMNLRFGEDEAIESIGDGKCCKNGRGSDQVVWLCAVSAAKCEQLFDESMAVVFAARGFGRGEF